MRFFSFLFGGDRHAKAAEKYRPIAQKINDLEPKFQAMSDDELKESVAKYKNKSLKEIKDNLPTIFAGIREGSKRVLKMRHFDVQLMGGQALLDGRISEMKTGEGKTLVATLPLITQALTGKGAHLITVNDYLAERDANWMKPLYEFFGLSVGVILPNQTPAEKRAQYAADITYGTNNEFGFDYLRDNMSQHAENLVQRELNYAIVDEVDSILIDESRTPLIISAPDNESTQLYGQFAQLVPQLKENDHYNIDEKRKAATLTDEGITKVESILGIDNIYEEKGIRFVHHLEQALRAQTLYHKDKDYVVQDNQVVIVDEFTGRLMSGRRYAEGLHQALEAKEGVKIQQESRTLATVTFQNFFRLYDHLAGMTGTAVTSAEEFEKVYNLDVVVIPTNKSIVRNDKPDRIYTTEEAKTKAIAEELKRRHEKGQPVLVGTVAIEKSEYISALLKREGVPHEVLNAKHHAREAEIITNAGQKGAITISTNMAGRGTDIKLGEGVVELGGLFVLGTERHEARRIDNQLRGRSGRQGDPGETQFFVSLEDDIMRVFGGDKIKSLMQRLKVPEDQPIENKMVSRALEGAQERVEGYYFDMRKQVLSYDDVLNRQRNAIYTLRRSVLVDGVWKEANKEPLPIHDRITELLTEHSRQLIDIHTADEDTDNWGLQEIAEVINSLTGISIDEIKNKAKETIKENESDGLDETRNKLSELVTNFLTRRLEERVQEMGDENLKQLEKSATLRALDLHWMDHLDMMDYLRTGIGLRGYGQRDPLVEYQKEGHRMFQEMVGSVKSSLIETVFKAQAIREEQEPKGIAKHPELSRPTALSQTPPAKEAAVQATNKSTDNNDKGPIRNEYKNVGRNDLCPCKSGKKFKRCHGA